MKVNLTKLIPFAALLCIVLASCKKNDAVTSPSQSNTQITRTTSMLGAMQSASDNEVSDALSDELSPAACPTITFDPSKKVYPHTKVIDYGSGCTDANGVTQSGKRFVTQYADYKTAPAGAVVNIVTYSNYYINGVNISGSAKISVVSAATPGPLVIRITESKTITGSDGNTSTYVGVTDRKQTAGDVNSPREDKAFEITTNVYGTEVVGDSTMSVWKLTSVPSKPISKMGDCLFRSKGAVKIILKQNNVTTNEVLDYGDGTCDNKATLSINGGTPEPIMLPFVFFASKL